MRLIEGDEHFGHIGFGQVKNALNAFAVALVGNLIEPDIIIKDVGKGNILEIEIEDILCWDQQFWETHASSLPDLSGSEDLTLEAFGGVTKDNTENATDFPTSDIVTQGTFPGGDQVGVTTLQTTVGDETPRYEARFEYLNFGVEENAAGEIVSMYQHLDGKHYQPYMVDGNTFFHPLTARHYHVWNSSTNLGALFSLSLGAYVRRISVEIKEVLFDRSSIIGLIEALQVLS